jgi:hypothetical protein
MKVVPTLLDAHDLPVEYPGLAHSMCGRTNRCPIVVSRVFSTIHSTYYYRYRLH